MTERRQLRLGRVEWALLFALAMLWGGSFFFVEIALVELPRFTIVLGRVGLAALVLLAYMRASGRALPTAPRLWVAFFAMGALNGLIPYSLIVWGQVSIDSGLAAILIAMTPMFSVLLAATLTREEPLTPARVGGVVLGLVGVAFLIGPAALASLGAREIGQGAVLLAALSYACAGIYGRRYLRGVSPVVAATGQITASSILVAPFALIFDQPWTLSPGWTTVGALVAVAVLSTALAYLIFFRVLATAGATNVMLVTFLQPIGALALGALILGEALTWNLFAGMALIFAGIGAIDGRIGRSGLIRLRALLSWRIGRG